MNNKIYWIGGSPCSGKSSIAEIIAEKHGYHYYKCDDHLDRYIRIGSDMNIPVMRKFASMDINQTWLERSVQEQVEDEVEFYLQAFGIIKKDIENHMKDSQKIIVEGAAILPHNIIKECISPEKYVCIVPTKEFQVEKYSLREWVKDYLKDCKDPEKAFNNWMERDASFSQAVRKKALEHNMKVIVEDGSKTVMDRYKEILDYWFI